MRVLVLVIMLTGCSTMTLRTGMAVVGGKPAFQASIEMGPSVMREHHGISATHEWGISNDGSGNQVLGALNLDHTVLDPDEGPVTRVGVRFRGTMHSENDQMVDTTDALLIRGAAYTGLGREQKTKSGGLGVEIGGGVASTAMRTAIDGTRYGRETWIFETNVVMHGHWSMD